MGSSELIFRGGHESQTQSDGPYSPKDSHPSAARRWAPLSFLLREQRLPFLLLGMALASLLFLAFGRDAPASPTAIPAATLAGTHLVSRSLSTGMAAPARQYGHRHVAAKVPLGLKRKGLRVVVTGGAGFVGSHLVDRLIARGDSVIVVDNFFTGKKENVMHHFGNPNFELIRHDVVEPLLLEVDQIYHLACPASPVHYKFNPVKTIISFSILTNFFTIFLQLPAIFLFILLFFVFGAKFSLILDEFTRRM